MLPRLTFPLLLAALVAVSPLFGQSPATNPGVSKARQPYLPDLKLTPGKVTPGWTLEMTKHPGGTKKHRSVSEALKRKVWARYGYDKTIGPYDENTNKYEINHLIPVCLGGASDIENLWPEPNAGPWNARIKDRFEKYVKSHVDQGKITLGKAQGMFTPNWVETYKTEGLPEDTSPSPAVDPASGGYVASTNSGVFHRAGCKSAEKISAKNLVRFATRDEAIKAGKKPCHDCNP